MSEDDSERYRAPALDKGLDILELLANTDGGLTQVEIAKAIDRNPNEFYRMLDRLVKRGYVQRLDNDRFTLTLKLFSLSYFHPPIRRLVSFATPIMRDLSIAAEQACHLAIYDRGSVVVIAQQDSSTYWALSIRVGAQMNLFTTGSGLVLLSFQTPAQREIMIDEQQRMHGGSKPKDLSTKIDHVLKDGFISMNSLQTAGVKNITAPIITFDGSAIAALTSPFIEPVNSDAPNELRCIELVRQAAEKISSIAAMTQPE